MYLPPLLTVALTIVLSTTSALETREILAPRNVSFLSLPFSFFFLNDMDGLLTNWKVGLPPPRSRM